MDENKALFCKQSQTVCYRFLFFIGTLFIFILKKGDLAMYVERLGYEFASMLVTFVCISGFDLFFWCAIVKVDYFATFCWVIKDKNIY